MNYMILNCIYDVLINILDMIYICFGMLKLIIVKIIYYICVIMLDCILLYLYLSMCLIFYLIFVYLNDFCVDFELNEWLNLICWLMMNEILKILFYGLKYFDWVIFLCIKGVELLCAVIWCSILWLMWFILDFECANYIFECIYDEWWWFECYDMLNFDFSVNMCVLCL